ncbi:MAG TPA: LuxR C-terminal-related transcriptional regulator [Solirubrobacteraceae bacterium]|nr:LuxR C-terminal-related transcriptional regulator [Solirubrobacteraceae bacterium]
MALLERVAPLNLLQEHMDDVCREGRGRLVLVSGEAGVGKTSLVRELQAQQRTTPVAEGACEPLFTPRPLGPLLDIAAALGGTPAQLSEAGPAPAELLAALRAALRRPHLIVLEDLHWADEATLDALRMLGRRVGAFKALVVGTYRDDELERDHPLRIVLGELPRTGRIRLEPLSPAAVAELAGAPADDLHARTGGNPFYVTELLAAGAGGETPATVRDAVLARAARLDPQARRLLDATAVARPRAEVWLLEAIAGPELPALERCLTSGVLRAEDTAVRFRHEIARAAIEESLPPDRYVALHRAALQALAGRGDSARLAHHAHAAGDAAAVVEYATEAAAHATALSAHREAAQHYDRALDHADALSTQARADLLERAAHACYLTGRFDDAVARGRAALEAVRALGDRLREGALLLSLSRYVWYRGDTEEGRDLDRKAIAVLEQLPSGPELARAYARVSGDGAVDYDLPMATEWGARAIALAQRLDEPELLSMTLNYVGLAELHAGIESGVEKAERGLALALEHDLEEATARSRQNLACTHMLRREWTSADVHVRALEAYVEDRDLDAIWVYTCGWRAWAELERGHWDRAAQLAEGVLDRPGVGPPTRLTPLVVLGLLRARRGDPHAWEALDEALALAERMREAQRLLPVAAARAEARWLEGQPEQVAAETEPALALLATRRQPWALGAIAIWRHRAGIATTLDAPVAPPFAAELDGDPLAAAESWRELGCPYDAALAGAAADDEAALRVSLDALQSLGAASAAKIVARRLRERGARNIRHGPRRKTLANPAGLTPRQLDVLRLLAEGASNAQIAARLFLSEKTVNHHVSAILSKLEVRNRAQASTAAVRLGIL